MGNPKFKKSFTIIEMLVSLTIFSIVTTVALGAFIIVLKGQRNALATQAVQGNASVLIESMAREMRTGTDFVIPGPKVILVDPPRTHGVGFEFTNAKGEIIEYELDSVNPTKLIRVVGGGTPTQISSNQVDITNLRFVVQGTASSDGMQPMVTIIMGFQNNGVRPEEQVSIDISTSITQRKLDELPS